LKLLRPLIIAAVLAIPCLGAQAEAVSIGKGDLFVTFDGRLNPNRLPRNSAAPVAVRVAGNVKSASGDTEHLPQLSRFTVEINRQGQLFDRGLPVCDVREFQPATEAAARRICGGAIIGSGHVTVQAHLPPQPPFTVRARLLAFNGPRQDGKKLIFAQAYSRLPPNSFVLTFRVGKRDGTYGTVLSTTLPARTRKWASLMHFDMTLYRVFDYRGRRRSYVSAACGAPAELNKVVFPFARATFDFVSGQRLTLSESGVCSVAG
jgi:hypothetical protein